MASRDFPRLGAWVLVAGAVGVIAQYPAQVRTTEEVPDPESDIDGATMNVPVVVKDAGHALVHFTNELGETMTEQIVPVEQITQAKLRDIPAARRPAVDGADPSLGYHDANDLAELDARRAPER